MAPVTEQTLTVRLDSAASALWQQRRLLTWLAVAETFLVSVWLWDCGGGLTCLAMLSPATLLTGLVALPSYQGISTPDSASEFWKTLTSQLHCLSSHLVLLSQLRLLPLCTFLSWPLDLGAGPSVSP